MNRNQKSILVTGAAGLLGSHLVDSLLARNYRVTGLDNLSIGSMDNLVSAELSGNFSFVKADVRDRIALKSMPRHDIIVHMAAYKIEVPGLKGIDILETNSFGTAALLDLAHQWKCRFVFASTSDVYGQNKQFPFSEESNLVLGKSDIPRWGYAASKIFDEHLCFAHLREHKTPVTVLRYFNTYGPRHELSSRSGGPQALFFDALLKNENMVVHGDGLQRRCFAYVSDSIEMTVRALEIDQSIGEIINIGNNLMEISIRDLAELAYKVTGGSQTPPIRFVTHEKIYKTTKYEEVNRRIPDISKAVKLLGFTPAISNEEGLTKTYDWQHRLPCYSERH